MVERHQYCFSGRPSKVVQGFLGCDVTGSDVTQGGTARREDDSAKSSNFLLLLFFFFFFCCCFVVVVVVGGCCENEMAGVRLPFENNLHGLD